MVSMGHEPTDEDVFLMISQVDDDNSGEIEFSEFLRVIENQHENDAAKNDESDTIQAFIALGGNEDKTGTISTEKLTAVCTEFGLTIDINALIKEFDADGSGEVDYDEFKDMNTKEEKEALEGGASAPSSTGSPLF